MPLIFLSLSSAQSEIAIYRQKGFHYLLWSKQRVIKVFRVYSYSNIILSACLFYRNWEKATFGKVYLANSSQFCFINKSIHDIKIQSIPTIHTFMFVLVVNYMVYFLNSETIRFPTWFDCNSNYKHLYWRHLNLQDIFDTVTNNLLYRVSTKLSLQL